MMSIWCRDSWRSPTIDHICRWQMQILDSELSLLSRLDPAIGRYYDKLLFHSGYGNVEWGLGLKFELQEIKVEGLVNTLGHMSWHPPNHTRREYVHPDGSVRIEHVAGV